MDYTILIMAIIKMTVIIGIGCILAHYSPFTESSKKLMVQLIINIALPSIIFNGFIQIDVTSELIMQLGLMFMVASLFILFCMLAGWFIARQFPSMYNKAKEVAFLSSIGNSGLIGIPLCAALFGPIGAVFASVYDAGTTILLFTLGIMMLQGQKKITLRQLKSLVNLPLIAVVMGTLVILFKIELNPFIKDVSQTLANTASPLALIYIGMAILPIIKTRKKVQVFKIALPVGLKLLIFPLITIVFFMFVPLPIHVLQVLLVQVSLPTITTASVILALYGADEEMGVFSSVFSIILSLLTIPLIIYIGRLLLW